MHTCPNGKVYIGITSRDCEARWCRGFGYKLNLHFYRAILKYGWDNIRHEIIYSELEKSRAKTLEIKEIAFYDSTNPKHGYNNSTGGEGKTGFVPTKHTRDKIRASLKGTHRPIEVCQKVSLAHKGKRLTEEHKRNIRNSCKNINGKPVECITTGMFYPSAAEAARRTGVSRSGITACCLGTNSRCKKTEDGTPIVWKFAERSYAS